MQGKVRAGLDVSGRAAPRLGEQVGSWASLGQDLPILGGAGPLLVDTPAGRAAFTILMLFPGQSHGGGGRRRPSPGHPRDPGLCCVTKWEPSRAPAPGGVCANGEPQASAWFFCLQLMR